MRQRALYDRLCVYVCPDSLSSTDFALLECCLRDGGATLASDPQAMTVTHVVCCPTDYQRFVEGRRARFYAIVRPEWVCRTFLLQKPLPVETFSANPQLFFSSLAIAAGSIDKDPRKVIDGLISHFGGQVIEDPKDTSGATHVLSPDGVSSEASMSVAQRAFQVAYTDADVERQVDLWRQWLDERPASLDFSLPGCVLAHVGKSGSLSETHHVNYAWIEECVRRKQCVAEAPFSKDPSSPKKDTLPSWKSRPDVKVEDLDLSNVASVYLNARASLLATTGELAAMRKVSTERLAAMQETLAGAIVLVAQHIPPQLKDPMTEILKAAKAKVANVPLGDSYTDIVRKVVTNASFVVCRYQSGLEYEEALKQNKQIVSVYWVLAGLGIPSEGGEMRDALLHPVKKYGGVPGMESFVITLSGFSSRTMPTREDVQMAIQATGACVLPVLSRSHSTHLLCYEAKGEKFKKAESWSFDNILSHEWLLECLLQWKYVSEGPFRMGESHGTVQEVPAGVDSTTTAPECDQAPESTTAVDRTPTGKPLTPPESNTKTVASRFDVEGILDELNEPTPQKTRPRRGAAGSTIDDSTPTTTGGGGGKRSLRQATAAAAAAANVELENGIPEDFEFQFGKKAKTKGKAKVSDRKVMFEEAEPEKELGIGKSKRKAKAASDAAGAKDSTDTHLHETPLATDAPDDDEASVAMSSTAAKPSEKKPATSGRKRKSSEPATKATETSAVPPSAGVDKPAPSATKKKKTSKAASEVVPTASVVSATSGKDGRLFLLTGSREECAINESIILALGGSVSQIGRIYDPKCTHIISTELKRTEKFVAGSAAGKWILKQTYLEACSAAGRFVDEVDHEWGAKEADMDAMDPRIWPPAPAFWRRARAAREPGALAGWRFVVHPKTVPPADMCERIIAASDGEVVPLTSTLDLAELASSATKQRPVVALVHTELSSRDTWFKKFKASKLQCINASFLIDYLTKDQTNRPKVDDYVL